MLCPPPAVPSGCVGSHQDVGAPQCSQSTAPKQPWSRRLWRRTGRSKGSRKGQPAPPHTLSAPVTPPKPPDPTARPFRAKGAPEPPCPCQGEALTCVCIMTRMTLQYFFMAAKSFSSCFFPASSCHFLQYLVNAFFLLLCLGTEVV